MPTRNLISGKKLNTLQVFKKVPKQVNVDVKSIGIKRNTYHKIDLKKANFKRELTVGSYKVIYEKYNKTLEINDLKKVNTKMNSEDLKKLMMKLKKIAKQLDCNVIYCQTWIFALNPLIKKALNFKEVNPGEEERFKNFLKKYNITAGTNLPTKKEILLISYISKKGYPEYQLDIE